MSKTPDQIIKDHYRRIGKKGNEKLRKIYTDEQRREWAKRGGRPRKKSVDN